MKVCYVPECVHSLSDHLKSQLLLVLARVLGHGGRAALQRLVQFLQGFHEIEIGLYNKKIHLLKNDIHLNILIDAEHISALDDGSGRVFGPVLHSPVASQHLEQRTLVQVLKELLSSGMIGLQVRRESEVKQPEQKI